MTKIISIANQKGGVGNPLHSYRNPSVHILQYLCTGVSSHFVAISLRCILLLGNRDHIFTIMSHNISQSLWPAPYFHFADPSIGQALTSVRQITRFYLPDQPCRAGPCRHRAELCCARIFLCQVLPSLTRPTVVPRP